jgi:hypothetical protein
MESANPSIVLAVPKDRAVSLALLSFVFSAAGFAYIGAFILAGNLNASLVNWAFTIIACLAVVVFAIGSLSLWIAIFASQASLVIDSRGVHNDTPLFGAGLIAWEEIAGLVSYRILTQRYLAIVLSDPRTLLARAWLVPKLILILNDKTSPAPINIPESLLPVSADQVLQMVRSQFAQEIHRHGIWLRISADTRA